MLYFSTGDDPTDRNLQKLDHLATLERFDDDPERMHEWLGAVIMSIGALPKAAAKHFTGFYYLGDSHFHMSNARRDATWRTLVNELREHVAAAHADQALRFNGPNGPADLSDRRETLGERITNLCEKLRRASWGTQEFDALLGTIGALAVGEIRSDVAELKKLSSRKLIRDLADHEYWIARHIAHIRLIANQFHHLAD